MVLVAPDETLLDMVQTVTHKDTNSDTDKKRNENGGKPDTSDQSCNTEGAEDGSAAK